VLGNSQFRGQIALCQALGLPPGAQDVPELAGMGERLSHDNISRIDICKISTRMINVKYQLS
jgi:hypothetical protein